MKIVRGFGRFIKPLVNFPAWMGWKQMKEGGSAIKEVAKALKPSAQKATRKETYEQAVARMHLSENDIQARMKQLRTMVFVYLAMAVGLFSYAIYLFINFSVMAGILSTTLTILALTLAFRQHFWYFQMKQRRLGCSIKEWLNATLRGTR